jgi:hypothetical protein
MIKRLCILIIISGFTLFISSCKKEAPAPGQSLPSLYSVPDNDYDKNLEDIAVALNQSLDDAQFCKTLKSEVLLQADGDYEVILKSFVKRNENINNTLLYSSLGGDASKGASGISALEKYPKLQIAMPVNADKWDYSVKPWILMLPEDYDDMTVKEVPAISPQGKKVMFKIDKEPDFPVIVLGSNERSNNNGDLKFEYNRLRQEVKFNPLEARAKDVEGFTAFSATPVTNAMAVCLSWTFVYPDYLQPYDHFFEIYRDDLTGGGFQKVGEASAWQTSYYDYDNVLPTRTYIYYVIAKVDDFQTYNREQYEIFYYSNTDEAALPQIPTFTNNFNVDCTGPATMKLTWTVNNISNWTNLNIERYTAYNPMPVVIATLPITAVTYTDNLINPNPCYGVTYRYTLSAYNANNGFQQQYYCDEMLANRIDNQQLRATHVQFNSFDDMRRYEAWTRGEPEVMLSVNMVSSGVPFNILSNVQIGGPASSGFDVYQDIWKWRVTDPKVFTISLNEDDGGSSSGVEVNLGVTVKLPKLFGSEVSTTFGVKGTVFKRANDDFIGTGYLYYWDNANAQNVSCGAYCRITIKSVPV